jgi:hypothetical protein
VFLAKTEQRIRYCSLDRVLAGDHNVFIKILVLPGRAALPKTDLRFNFDQASTVTRQMLTQMPQWLKLPFLRSWVFWALITCGLCGGMGYVALGMLLNPKASPNCPELFLPMAPASLRVYCGQVAASKQTLKDLTAAFNFVKDIPKDDPMRAFVDSNIQQWSIDLLRLTEIEYQKGDLETAVATAKLVPNNVPAYAAVKKRIERWQKTWKEAQEIYQKTEKLLRSSRWLEAYQVAVKLTKLNNEYWGTTKYQELADLVQQAKEDSAKLDNAHRLVKSSKLEDLLQAISISRKIDKKSYAYQESQELIAQAAKQMLDLAKTQLSKNNWQAALEITRQTPSTPEIQVELKDVADLAEAQSFAKNGTISDLERAIGTAQGIKPESTVYARAQQLLTGWQLEVSDVAYLQRAKSLAASGQPKDLEAAIKEASQIPANNPRAQEAATTITGWRKQIQTVQDQPYLQAAENSAAAGTVAGLQQAISQAQQIPTGRALSGSAQQKIQQWTAQIQRMQDAPILENAEQQARNGNTAAAIALAKQIGPGRALYNQAQQRIGSWSGETESSDLISLAQQRAAQGSAEDLLGAIEAVRKIPQTSSSYAAARASINKWSGLMYQQAQNAAGSKDFNRAIAIAKVIPQDSTAYTAAQKAIQRWESSGNQPSENNSGF